MTQYHGTTAVAQPPVGADLGCKHFWLIDTPMGPVSRGLCKLCGEHKKFKNYLESASYWDDEPALASSASGGRYRRGETLELFDSEE